MIFKQWIITPKNVQKAKLEVCRSIHLVSQRSLVFLRYIVLITFSTAPLLKDSTRFSSNSYYLGEYLNKILSFFITLNMHCISLILQAIGNARLWSWKAQWKYDASGASRWKCATQLLCWPVIFQAPSLVWDRQSGTKSCADSNIETILRQTDSPVMLL